MEAEDIRRELDGLKASLRRKPSRGWVIACSIITTLLVLVVLVVIMMFGMMNHMRSGGGGWRGHNQYFSQPHRQSRPPAPPGQPLP